MSQGKLSSLLSYINSIGLTATLNYICQRYIVKSGNIFVKVPGIPQKIRLRRCSTDVNVFHQIFIKREFAFLKSGAFRVVIDCGANIGLSTIYFKYLFPEATIYSIEPEANNFKMLQLNTSSYANIILINKALSNNDAGVYLIDNGKGSDAFQTKKESGGEEILTKTESISIQNLMHQYKVEKLDLVKIDIEGAEAYCIKEDAMDWVSVANTLAIEIHDHIIPGTSSAIKKLLSPGFNFSQQGEYSVFKRKIVFVE